jgi:hypothetical protein
MILLDPGSHAFDYPKSYGYRLIFKNLEDYIKGMSLPSWHQWISYETDNLSREEITRLIIDSLEYSINLRERYGFYSKTQADIYRLCFVTAYRSAIEVVDRAMAFNDEDERLGLLWSLRHSLDRNIPHSEFA